LETEKEINFSQIIEAILFLENRPVNIDFISKVTSKNREYVRKGIDKLKERLKKTDSSLIIVENNKDDFQLTISPSLYDYLGKYYDKRKKLCLSSQALETLSIIAYKQPVTRVEIEKTRGVQVGYILRVLLEHELIKIVGKKDVPGKPIIYGTTDKFLKYFGLMSINDLPPASEFEKTL